MLATITIKRGELLYDIYNRSHEEAKLITDAEARYRAEAREDKAEMLNRLITESTTELRALLQRILQEDYNRTEDNVPDTTEDITLNLSMSARRIDNKLEPLAEKSHAYIVNTTLARYYSLVGQGNLSNLHAAEMQADAATLTQLVYSKMPPII